MIINELAYKVTIKADEFLNGKRKREAHCIILYPGKDRIRRERKDIMAELQNVWRDG